MNIHVAKHALVWTLFGILGISACAMLCVPLWAAARAYTESANIRQDAAELIQRRQTLTAQVDALSAQAWAEPIVASGVADAVNQLEVGILASLSVGRVLDLDIRPVRDGVIEARLHWRGTEAQMRTGLEALAVALPHSAVAELAIRTNEGDLDVIGMLRQGWEEAR